MAHYKRGYSRTVGRRKTDKWKGKKFDQGVPGWDWMGSWPRWWDIVFHRRPHRRRAAEVTRAVVLDKLDADNAVWPVSKKPHNYYW